MVSAPSSHRSLALLTVVLGAQVLLLAMQIKRDHEVPLVRVWAVESVAPFGRAASWTTGRIRGAWSGYIGLRHLRTENEQLRTELNALKLRNTQLESHAAESARLSALLGFRETHSDVAMIAARVIGASPDNASRIIFLDRGSRDGLAPDMGVITPDGVIGKLLAVFPETSQVLLLSDKNSGVGALIAQTRVQGPVRGTGAPTLQMEYITNEVPVAPGQVVLTSGQDQIFPKDLPVGTVLTAEPAERGPFQQIVVRPAARLDRLEEVLILLTRKEFALDFRTGQPVAAALPAQPLQKNDANP